MNTTYTNWCRMPSPTEIAREADLATQALLSARTFDVGQQIVYSDYGDDAPGVVLAVADGDMGPRYEVRVTSHDYSWTLWCSGADLT